MAPKTRPILELDLLDDADAFDELDDDEGSQEFQINNRLPAPQAMMYRTKDLHELIHIGEVDLNPPYQRDVVWPEYKQVKLIDSLYRNYYIPPVIFTIVKEESGAEIRKCVDGKQRLTSIQSFIDGQIPYRDPNTRKAYWYTSSGPGRQIIPQSWKDDFANKLITCVEYRDLPDSLERDIFQRVQLGMPLTAAEKLQAHSSPRANYISDLTQLRLVSNSGISSHIAVDTTRGRDFHVMAQLVYCCEGIPERRYPSAHKLDVWLQQKDQPDKHFQNAITKALQTFQFVASTPGYNLGFTEIANRVAPVEFVFIGVLIFVMRDCDQEEIADQILAMRREARKKYKDIRANNFVTKYLWEFIGDLASRLDTGVYVDDEPGRSKTRPIPRKTKKRVRNDDAGDENPSTRRKSQATSSRR